MKPGELVRLPKGYHFGPMFAVPAPDRSNKRAGTLFPGELALMIALQAHCDKLHALVLKGPELGWIEISSLESALGGWLKSRVLRRSG